MTNTMLVLIGFYLDWKLGLALLGLKTIEYLWVLKKEAEYKIELERLQERIEVDLKKELEKKGHNV